jgi:hypothetical protein
MASKFVRINLKPEPKTDYVDYKPGGSKHCFNCRAFRREENGCAGPKMKELSERPTLANGDVKVHPVGLCKFWKAEE